MTSSDSAGPTWEITPWQSAATLQGICDGAIASATSMRDELRAPTDGPRTVDNTLRKFNALFVAIDTASGLAGLMFQVHPDEAVRNVAQTCQQRVSELESSLFVDRALFEAVSGIDAAGAEPLAARTIERMLREFKRSGVDRDEAARKRLTDIKARMVELSQAFSKNVATDTRSIRVKPEILSDLPADFRAANPPDDDGLVEITTDYPEFIPFQTYAGNEPARAELYKLFLRRGYPANRDVMMEVLSLRSEYASILGFETWADYFAEDKMVKTAKTVESFIEKLLGVVKPRNESDLKALLARKKRDDADASAIEMWDRFYYVGKVREESHDFDARTVRPYFPYEAVKTGIMDLYGELFGLRFVELPNEPVWHPSVDAFALYRGDELIGRFFLDMHSRPDKFKHAAMFPVQTGLSPVAGDSGSRIPIASLVCNFSDPSVGDGQGLMEHSDVVTFFHEFGHLVHHLLARGSQWLPLAGLQVEWDFVEAPSQLLEEWAWNPEVLARFAKHVETGEPISADIVARMRGAEEFGKGLHVMRQLYYTAYSYFLHVQDPKSLDLDQFTAKIAETYSPFPIPDDTHLYANFGHLMGYTSAYYTYQWSLVIAKDLFTRFKSEGLLNPEVAAAYRQLVLEPGATKDAADLVEDFLGRPYSLDAYREWLEAE